MPTKTILYTTFQVKRILESHIICGDVSDGIPNILSSADTFQRNIRTPPITKKFLDKCFSVDNALRTSTAYERNNVLINFENIPTHIKNYVILEYAIQKNKEIDLEYMIEHNLEALFDAIA